MAAIFQAIFSNAFSCIKMYKFQIKISLKFVPKVPINNIPAMVQIMAWHWLGDKSLSELMMVCEQMHIYTSLELNELTQKTGWCKILWNKNLLNIYTGYSYTKRLM